MVCKAWHVLSRGIKTNCNFKNLVYFAGLWTNLHVFLSKLLLWFPLLKKKMFVSYCQVMHVMYHCAWFITSMIYRKNSQSVMFLFRWNETQSYFNNIPVLWSCFLHNSPYRINLLVPLRCCQEVCGRVHVLYRMPLDCLNERANKAIPQSKRDKTSRSFLLLTLDPLSS